MSRIVKAGPPPNIGVVVGEVGRADYTERVMKYIPGEIVAGYVALSGMIAAVPQQDQRRTSAAWILFFVGLVVTPVYLFVIGKPATRPERLQLWIPTIAFVLWAYTLGGPFEMSSPLPVLGAYEKWIGAVALGLFTWVGGLFKPWPSPQPSH